MNRSPRFPHALRRVGLLVMSTLCGSWTQCGQSAASRAGQAAAKDPQKRISMKVSNSDELNQLQSRYLGLIAEGKEAVLEVELGPGTYGKASIGQIGLTLEGMPSPPEPKIDVILRGRSGAAPVVFSDMFTTIAARNVVLEDLVIARRHSAGVLRIQVAGSIRLRRCAVVDHAAASGTGGSLVELGGVYGPGPYQLEVEDSWFARNAVSGSGALLSASAGGRGFFNAVRFRNTAFVGNQALAGVSLAGTKEVEFRGCFIQWQQPAGGSAGPASFVMVDGATRGISFVDSVLILDRAEGLCAQGAAAGVAVKSSRLYVADPAAAPPPWLKLSASLLANTGGAVAREGPLRAALDALTGAPLPVGSVLAQLKPVFGLE